MKFDFKKVDIIRPQFREVFEEYKVGHYYTDPWEKEVWYIVKPFCPIEYGFSKFTGEEWVPDEELNNVFKWIVERIIYKHNPFAEKITSCIGNPKIDNGYIEYASVWSHGTQLVREIKLLSK